MITDVKVSGSWQDDVLAFHKKFQVFMRAYPGDVPENVKQFRMDLILEEIDELREAFEANNLDSIADNIVDSIYVLIGAALAFGIDLRPVWDEVHKANMKKIRVGDADIPHKIQKPEGWVKPNVRKIIDDQIMEYYEYNK